MDAEKILLGAWNTVLENSPDMIFIKDINLVYLCASRVFCQSVGLSEPRDVAGKTDWELFTDQELARRYRNDDESILKSGEACVNYIEPIVSPDDRPRWGETSKYIIRDEAGAAVGIYGISRDVTAHLELRQSYERERDYLMERPRDAWAAVLLDITDWRVCQSNIDPAHVAQVREEASIEDYMRRLADSVLEDETVRSFFTTFSPQTIRKLHDWGRRSLTMEYRRRMYDGETRWIRSIVNVLVDPRNGHLMAIVSLIDVDERKREQEKLAAAAEQDSMTGLLNHDSALRKMEEFLTTAGREGRHALFMVDIDGFKSINDTFGHIKGDEVITEIASAVKSAFRTSDIVGRIGGDEFLALMKDAVGREQAAKKAAELVRLLDRTYTVGDASVHISASVGVSLYYPAGMPFSRLEAEADAALYQAKGAGKNRFAFA